MKSFKNANGISIVECIVVVTITMISLLVFTQILQFSTSSSISVRDILTNVDSTNTLRLLLSNPTICAQAFRDSDDAVSLVKLKETNPIYAVKNGKQVILEGYELSLTKFTDLDAAKHEYLFHLNIKFKHSSSASTPPKKDTQIPIFMRLSDSTGAVSILYCSTSIVDETAPGSLCGMEDVDGTTAVAPCQGHNPGTSCPSGYTRFLVAYAKGNSIYSCVKN